MAEVTGSFGDQPVELNNAATEATLKELVAAIGVLSTKVGGKARGTQDIEKELKKFQEAVKKQTDVTKELTEEEKKAIERKKEEAKQAEARKKAEDALEKVTHGVAKGFGTLGRVTSQVALGMTNLLSSISNVGNSMTSAASTMNNIPVIGSTLAGVFGAVAEASEKLHKSYQAAATVGVTFGGSVNTMVNAASAAGLTFDQFAGIIKNNSEGLMMFGGTAEAGAKRLSEMGRDIRNSQIGKELLRMGFSTEQVNDGMAKYVGMISRTGAQQGMSTAQLAASAGKYMKELDALARLTGQSKEALEQEQQARLAEANFNQFLVGKKPEEIAMLQNFVSSFPKAQQAAVQEMLTTGNITSDAGVKFNAMFGQSAQEIMNLNRIISASGKVSQADLDKAYGRSLAEQKAFQKSDMFRTMSQYAMDEYGQLMVSSTQMAARDENAMQKLRAEQQAALEKANQAQQIEQFKQQLAEASNVFTQIIAQSGLLEKLQSAFDLLVGVTLDYVVPTFNFLADNFGTVVTIAAVLGGTFLALQGFIMAANVVTAARTLAEAASSVGLAALAATAWAAVKPLIAFAAPVLLAVAAVTGLYMIFKKFGGDMDVITDSLKVMWSGFKSFLSYLKLGFYKVLDSLPGVNYGKEIEETQKEIADQELERQELANNIAKRMEENRKKEEADSKKSNLDKARERIASREAEQGDKKKAEEAKKAAAADKEKTEAAQGYSNEVGTGNPLVDMAMYAKKKIQEAVGRTEGAAQGATAAGGLGSLAARYESGGKGSEAVGWDSTGGTSFGKYQIATKTGTMDQFMKFLQTDNPEAYKRLMAAGPADSGKDGKFAQEWKALAKEGKLGDSEHKFIKATHYDKAMGGLEDATLKDMISKSGALQEVMWSTSVQHGAKGAEKIFESVFKKGMSEDELIKAVYAERAKKFGSSTAQVQASVQRRFVDEQSRALAMVGAPSTVTPSGTQVAQSMQRPTEEEEAKRRQAAAGTPDRRAEPSRPPVATAATGKAQESAETLLERLNMQVGELIAVTRDSKRVSERQLGVMADNSMNVYSIGA